MDMDVPSAGTAANGAEVVVVESCDQQQTTTEVTSTSSQYGWGQQNDHQGGNDSGTSRSMFPPLHHHHHHQDMFPSGTRNEQEQEQDDGHGNNQQQQTPQDGAVVGTSSSLTSSTTSDTSGPADDTTTTTTTTTAASKNFYYRNVHNLPNAKKMRTAAAAASSYASSEGSGVDSGSHGGGSRGCPSPRPSPLLSARDDAPSLQHAPSRHAVFSPPTGLEKRFEEVLRLEDSATTEYKMGQRIKMNKSQPAASVSGPASTATATAATTRTTTIGSTASASASGDSSSSDGNCENGKNNSDDMLVADYESRTKMTRNQERMGRGVGNQENDDGDEDGDGDHDSNADALVIPDITQEELEKLLYAKDMYEMSAAEREYVLQDIHGVADMTAQEIESDDKYHGDRGSNNTTAGSRSGSSASEFVELKRQQLQQALLQSPTHGTAAYSQAVRVDYGYVTSSEFQLPFLRSNQWNVEDAAKQIINYFDIKLQLFGPKLLCKPKITLGDLSKEDRKQMESGFFQFLPVRDVAGRAIVCAFPSVGRQGPVTSLVRAFYYIIMSLIEDVETQRNGMILMGVNVGPKRRVDREVVFNVHKVRRALPIRTVAIHYCYDDMRMIPMMTLGMLAMGAAGRVRFRPHYGDWRKDISYQLSTFGLPADAVPITEDGEVKVKTFKSWIKARRSQEDARKRQQLSTGSTIVIPTRADVLYGRGKPIQDHVGNLRYHALLEYYHSSYEDAKKFQKKQLANRIVSTVHEYGGRFLKQDSHGAGWVEVDETVACDKVSHAFRTRRTAAVNSKVCTSSTSDSSSDSRNKRRNFSESDSVETGRDSGVSSPDAFMHQSNNVSDFQGKVQLGQPVPSQHQMNVPSVPNFTSSSEYGQENQIHRTVMTSEAYCQQNWGQPGTGTQDTTNGMYCREDNIFDDSDKNAVEIWENTSFHPL